MSTDEDPAPSGTASRPTVSNESATIDFRDVVDSRPTRSDVGMGEEGFVSYPTGSSRRSVPTTLRLPTGTVRRDFFQINIGTNFAFALDKDLRHPPTDFEFFLKARNLEEAKIYLGEDADALGLTPAEVDDVTAEGTSVEQGYVKDRLATEVTVRDAGSDDSSLNLIYTVTIDSYHNEAVDKILKDGVVSVDLSTAPTRAGLGFLPTYDSATVSPEPGKSLRLSLTTPTGTAALPLDSLISEAKGETPAVSVASAVSTAAELRTALQRAATALGVDAAAAASFLQEAGPTLATRTFTCADTDVYTCALRLQTTTSPGEEPGATYRLTLTYR